jgi:hypothetical protein
MKAIRETRPQWLVMRFERDEHGLDDDCKELASFWERPQAIAERERLARLNTNPPAHYEVIEVEVTVAFPDDEPPPWVSDPDRWKKRGYERPRPG